MEEIVARSNLKRTANDRHKTHNKTYNLRKTMYSLATLNGIDVEGAPNFGTTFFLANLNEKIAFSNTSYA